MLIIFTHRKYLYRTAAYFFFCFLVIHFIKLTKDPKPQDDYKHLSVSVVAKAIEYERVSTAGNRIYYTVHCTPVGFMQFAFI